MKELIKIQTELKCNKTLYNKFGNYYYRSAETILESVKPLLKELNCSLIISDEIIMLGNRFYVKATVTLSSEIGSWTSTAYAREEETKKEMDGAQITGAASSYARKYALNGLFAIDDTKDADATNDHVKTEVKPAKEALTPDHKNWSKVIEYLKGTGTMSEVQKKYTIDETTEKLLINEIV